MSIHDLSLACRSYRSFDRSIRITEKQLLSWIDNARTTPSTGNIQPIKYFYSVSDETNEIFRSHTRWAALLKDYSGPDAEHNPVAYIAICIDGNVNNADYSRFARDVGICAQTIMLSAAEDGINGCMIGNFDSGLNTLLGLPDGIKIALVLALGKGKEDIILEEVKESTAYHRENGIHYVPKRALEDIIINKGQKNE